MSNSGGTRISRDHRPQKSIYLDLENQLQRKLDDPRVSSPGNAAESARVDVRIRPAEIDTVKDVKEFRPELQPHALADRNILEQRKVDIR